jgi:membrane-associated phospholipid phosphatase
MPLLSRTAAAARSALTQPAATARAVTERATAAAWAVGTRLGVAGRAVGHRVSATDRAVGHRVSATDRAVMARVAATESPVLDRVMPALSQAANQSVLWIGVAAALAATGHPRARRAALRGLASVALASTASNVIGKGLTGRARPSAPVPPARRLAHGVRTTSFPSGHAASAAAFATGAALEFPALAAPVGALAAAVGASRVVTGVHFPSDVLAGFAVGVAAGALTLRCRPRHPSQLFRR